MLIGSTFKLGINVEDKQHKDELKLPHFKDDFNQYNETHSEEEEYIDEE